MTLNFTSANHEETTGGVDITDTQIRDLCIKPGFWKPLWVNLGEKNCLREVVKIIICLGLGSEKRGQKENDSSEILTTILPSYKFEARIHTDCKTH